MLLLLSLVLVLGTVAWFILGVQGSSPLPLGTEQLIHARIPWLALGALALGCGLGMTALLRRRRWYTWGLVGVELVLSGLLGFYFLRVSFLPEHTLAVIVGDRFPSYALADQDGVLRSNEGDVPRTRALYIFYRGDW